ncbi:unnamed protein product [Scytosiphon promiscuus]
MKPTPPISVTGGTVLVLASQRIGAVPCTTSTFPPQFVVNDTAGAVRLATATNCSGGTFDVSWVGSVTVEDTIRVAGGSNLSVMGTPDGSSIVNGMGQVSLFEVIGGDLRLSSLSLNNGNGAGSGGGAIFAVDSVLEIASCSFLNNVGDVGGGIFLENSTLDVTESIFERNFAPQDVFENLTSTTSSTSSFDDSTDFSDSEGVGGAIYAIDSILTSENCTFSGNGGYDGGGVFYIVESVSDLVNCTFFDNVGYDGGGIFLDNSVLNASGSSFAGNSATNDGGAILSIGSNITISGTTAWDRNSAVGYGGAIAIESSSKLNILGDSRWTNNSARDSGGALSVKDSILNIPGNTFWAENSAVEDSGGAIFADESSLAISGNATWVGNSAVEMGGAVSAEDCTFSMSGRAVLKDNTNAGSWYTHGGGGIGIDTSSLDLSNHVEFIRNKADNGGGLWASEFANITISGSAIFESNEAEADGGGFFVGYGSRLGVLGAGRINFSSNVAGSNGGGLFCDTAVFEDEGQYSSFKNNSADVGAGIFLGDGSSLTLTGGNSTVSENNAASRGGGIYAEATTQFVVESSMFVSNFAGIAGGAMSLLSVGTTSNAEGSDEAAIMSGCHFTRNEAGESGGAASIAGGYLEMLSSHFDGNTAGDEGGAIVASGVIELENCTFDDNRASSGSAVSNTVVATLVGAEFVNNALLCVDESFYLEWDYNVSAYATACVACDCSNCTTSYPDQALLCSPVMEHTTSPTADGTIESLDLSQGYWRSSSTSTVIRECYETESCTGGSEEYCKIGYSGPFCAVCADGYAAGSGYTCSKCTGARAMVTVGVGIVLSTVGVIAVATTVKYLGSLDEVSSVEERQSTLEARFEGSRLSRGVKIVIVSWQIVSQFSSVASVTYPDVYDAFVGYMDFLKLDVAWMLSAKCWFETDFYDSLLAITIGPLVVCGLALASFMRSSGRSPSPALLKEIKRRHATFAYIVSVLVYSTASSAVFQVFACDHLDNGKAFLRADHSIQCYTATHKGFMAYAGLMFLVYPLGIPFCYAVILYQRYSEWEEFKRKKREKKNAPVKLDFAGGGAVFRALSEPYRGEIYFYEVVECLRRVTLSGLVVFILPNSAGQVITTFLLSLLFFGIFMGLDPHEDPVDKWLDRIGHVVVMMSMFVALAIKVDIEGDDRFSQEVFGGALVATNCVLVSILVVQAYMMCKDATKRERGRRRDALGGRPVACLGPRRRRR